MSRYTEELIRREAQLEEMRRDERDDQNFVFGIIVVMAAVAGATFTLFIVALAVMLVFFGNFSVRTPTRGIGIAIPTNAVPAALTDTPPDAIVPPALPLSAPGVAPTVATDGSATAPGATSVAQPETVATATPMGAAPPVPGPDLPPDTPAVAALPPAVAGGNPAAPPVNLLPATPNAPPLPNTAPPVDPLATTAVPQPAPAPPLVQPPVTPAVPFSSGGLGVSRVDWETMYGSVISPGLDRYGDPGNYTQDLIFVDDRVQAVTWQVAQPVIAEVALSAGNDYVPSDGQYVNSYAPEGRPDTNVDVYTSQSLAGLLGADNKWWNGSAPGTYIVQFTRTPTGISSVRVSTGNTP